jgi:2-iminobutanoate/2-iminopropanoate deaminase
VDRIETGGAPAAVGPYSQAVAAGDAVYTAGQIGLDPATGQLVEGGVEAEAERVLGNLGAILAAAGTDFNAVVRATIYLVDIADFQAVNAIYARHLGDHRPSRSTVGVAALPLGARVLIDMIAVRGG